MANINTINFDKQLNFTGAAYLDKKMMPLETYADIKKLELTECFPGMQITKLSDENYNGETTHYVLLDDMITWKLADLLIINEDI